jgi:hypothetical protein
MKNLKNLLSNFLFALITLSATLGMVELVSRYVLPISPGAQNLDKSGKEITIGYDGSFRMKANLVFRQVSQEFNATGTTTNLGNRPPITTGNPDTIVLGDSFTFGHGLKDSDTFIVKYCESVQLSCANLARSGTGTGTQLDILETYLETERWAPRHVKLFMLVMSTSLMSGNDLEENRLYDLVKSTKSVSRDSIKELRTSYSTSTILMWVRKQALGNSNLARVTFLYAAPILRSWFAPKPDQSQLSSALSATEKQLRRLHALSLEKEFSYTIYVLHPMQDIIRGTDDKTADLIQSIVQNGNVVRTAQLFTPDTESYYFSYDGHFNSKGAELIASFLIAEHGKSK